MPANRRSGQGFLYNYCLSSVAAVLAESVTFPLDITKTRLQIQGERASMIDSSKGPAPYRGMIRTALGIVKEEGLSNLWKGITPALLRHIVYSGSRIAVYEFLRGNVFVQNVDGTFPVWKSAISGVTAGAIGQLIASPTDLVKVQMQVEGRRVLVEGRTPRIRGTFHAFYTIARTSGVRSLWKGWVPNVQRAALVNVGDLTTYDTSKQFILRHSKLQDNWVVHTMASVCSGFVASVVSTPADVIKTRIMNNPTAYRGSVDCLVRAIKDEGFMPLYKGFLPTWTRLAPWLLTFWLTYEQIRKLTGLAKF